MLRVTEVASIAAYGTIGYGDAMRSDNVAVVAARAALNEISMRGTIVVGEGERDKAPMLYIGEELGSGVGPLIHIAVDPLECTTSCAMGRDGSMVSLAFGPSGCFMSMPDVYLEKLVAPVGAGELSLNFPVKHNIIKLAELLNKEVGDLRVVVLNRPRHQSLIEEIRIAGARVILIEDGDIWGAVSVVCGDNDMYVGTGGSPEGVLAAAALKCAGGFMETRFISTCDEDRDRIESFGIDMAKIYGIPDLIKSKVCFITTGVTSGNMVDGVRKGVAGAYSLSSVVIINGSIYTIQNDVLDVI